MKTIGLWLWYLFPGNPVLGRILHGGSRRVRHLLVRCGYLLALMALVFIGLIAGQTGAGNVDLSKLAQAGSQVFAVIAYGQVVLVCLLAPIFMAGAIQQERAGETMDILLTTPLSNLQVVLGTLFGRLFFVLALLASGLPLFSVLLIFGGVPVRSVFVAFAVAGLVTVTVGSVAILLAVLRKGGRKAVYVFVIAIAAYLVGCYSLDRVVRLMNIAPVATAAATSSAAPDVPSPTNTGLLPPTVQKTPKPTGPARVNQGEDTFNATDFSEDEVSQVTAPVVEGSTTWLTPLHPLLVLEASLNKPDYRPPTPEDLVGKSTFTRFYLGNPLGAFAAWNITLSMSLILFSALQLRRIGQGAAIIPLPMIVRRVLRLRGPGERRRPPRTVTGNPIAWRESHTRGKLASAILGRWGFVFVGLTVAIVLLLMYHTGNLPTLNAGNAVLGPARVFKTLLQLLLWIELAIIVLVALYMSAGCVSREREDGTLDLMLTTPITPRQYIWGKIRGLVSFLAVLLSVPILTLLLISVYTVIGQAQGWPQASMPYNLARDDGTISTFTRDLVLLESPILLAFMLVPFVAFCVSLGMYFSIKARGVMGAIIPSIAIIGPIVLIMGFCGGNLSSEVPIIGPVFNAFSPATNIQMLLNPWEEVKSFEDTAGRLQLIVAALAVAGMYSLFVYLFLTSQVRNFDHTVRRLTGTN